MNAAIYVRISNDRAGAGLGVARQERDCRALVRQRGWRVHDVYVDNDLSAYSGKPRPAYDRLLADVEAGLVDAIVAWHTDRLHRSPRELERFIDTLEPRNVTVETVTAGPLDLATASGRAVARTLGAWARFESEHKSERLRRKHLEVAQAGGVGGGGERPFGYDKDGLRIREDEAAELRWAVDQVLAGRSVRSILMDWYRRGVTTARGNPWSQPSFRRVVTSYRIAGWRSHRGVPVAPAVWPGIIDRDTLERVRAIMLDPARRAVGRAPQRYPLRPLVFCADCGLQMWGRPREDGVRRYICAPGPPQHGCGRVIMATPLEDHVFDRLVAVLDAEMLDKAHRSLDDSDSRREQLYAQLRADEESLTDAAHEYRVERILTRTQFLSVSHRLQGRIDEARKQLAAVDGSPLLAGLPVGEDALRAWWADADPGLRGALIRAVVDRVVVGPAVRGLNKFDPRRVSVQWAL